MTILLKRKECKRKLNQWLLKKSNQLKSITTILQKKKSLFQTPSRLIQRAKEKLQIKKIVILIATQISITTLVSQKASFIHTWHQFYQCRKWIWLHRLLWLSSISNSSKTTRLERCIIMLKYHSLAVQRLNLNSFNSNLEKQKSREMNLKKKVNH